MYKDKSKDADWIVRWHLQTCLRTSDRNIPEAYREGSVYNSILSVMSLSLQVELVMKFLKKIGLNQIDIDLVDHFHKLP